MRATLAIGLILLTACSGKPPKTITSDDAGPWHVYLHTDGEPLGAYTVVIRYNPDIADIKRIESGSKRGFAGSPTYDPKTFSSDVTRVTSFDASASGSSTGGYHLLKISFL